MNGHRVGFRGKSDGWTSIGTPTGICIMSAYTQRRPRFGLALGPPRHKIGQLENGWPCWAVFTVHGHGRTKWVAALKMAYEHLHRRAHSDPNSDLGIRPFFGPQAARPIMRRDHSAPNKITGNPVPAPSHGVLNGRADTMPCRIPRVGPACQRLHGRPSP
jgi:hypothetical protein